MAESQVVLIEFQVDDTQIVSALERLEATGAVDSKLAGSFKQTTAEISKQSNEIKKAATSTAPLKKNLEDVSKATKQFTKEFMAGFNEGVIETLQEAGVSVEQFTEALKTGQTEVEAPTDSLRARLKALTQQIAEMKLAGDDGTEAFQKLVIEAGNIKDAIGDAAAEIKNAGSDTRTFDNLLGAAQAVAGGFAVAQGAAALFGDESEELQETLLKVNAAMSILQGLQTVSNSLQQEGAIVQLFSNKQRIIGNAQLAVENGLQSTSAIVRLAATAAQWALNAAMAANPILLFVSALVLVVTAMATYIKSSKDAEIQTGELNAAVEAATEGFENYALRIKQESEKAKSELEKNGALQSEILKSQFKAEQDINQQRSQEIARLRQFLTTSRNADEKAIQAANERLAQLTKDRNEADTKAIIDKNNVDKQLLEESIKSQIAAAETELLVAKEGSDKQLQLQKKLVSLRAQQELNAAGLTEAEKTKIVAKAIEERAELDVAASKREIDRQLKAIDTKLINAKEGSEEELKLKQKQIELQTQSELTNTKLSEAEKEQIKKDGFAKLLKLQTDYNIKVEREAIEGQISRNNAELSLLETNNQNRLVLQIANIELAAAAEVNAANGNAAKIKEINAKRDADILAVRKQFIDDATQYEIAIRDADNGRGNRALQRTINDETMALNVRKAAISQLAEYQTANIDKQLNALKKEKDERLISDEEYLLKYKQLQDKKKEITEESEKATTDLIKAENIKRVQNVIQVLSMVADLVQSINETETQEENDRITAQKERTQELLDAGAITEKQAAARNKRIEAEEKKARAAQAKREKDLAVFRALLAIPQAILQGLEQGGPFLAAIYGALATAQAVIIASRPLPRFGHGKKSGYEGLAEIGETGPELYEQNGKMFLADKSQLVWLAAKDKVYNPTETKEMLMPVVDKQLMQWLAPVQKQPDAREIAAELAKQIKKIPSTNVNIDEHGLKVWVQEGMSRKNYMDKRYSSK